MEVTMKFYDCVTAPSPRRVRVFLFEKGISLPTVQVDLRNGEQFSPAFRAINPDCTVPVLELDNGTTIAGILGIFEELYPEPRLIGRTAEEKALAESWQRRREKRRLALQTVGLLVSAISGMARRVGVYYYAALTDWSRGRLWTTPVGIETRPAE
jgi:glutathione S-transferase